jgi:hypothetical protein
MSFRGMIILAEQLAVTETVDYEVVKLSPDDYTVQGYTQESRPHRLNITNNHLSCDCFMFNNFQLFCRHVLVMFHENPDYRLLDYIGIVNNRWLKTYDTNTPSLTTRSQSSPHKLDKTRTNSVYCTMNETIMAIRNAFAKFDANSASRIGSHIIQCLRLISDTSQLSESDEPLSQREQNNPDLGRLELVNYGTISIMKPPGRKRKSKKDRFHQFNSKKPKLLKSPKKAKKQPRKPSKKQSKKPEPSLSSASESTLTSASRSTVISQSGSSSSSVSLNSGSSTSSKSDDLNVTTFDPKGKLTIEQLRAGEWLTDTEIECFLKHLRKSFHKLGLEDPLILSREPQRVAVLNRFVRVVISKAYHLVVVASCNTQFEKGDIVLLDSSIRSKIDSDLGTVVAYTINPIIKTKGRIVFKLLKTQKQSSCVCGYFALANATALCYGFDPETLVFDQK